MIKRSLVCVAMVFAIFFAAAPISVHAAEGAKDTNGKRVTAAPRSADSNALYRTGPASA
ncbi:MAG: hypothetical protein HUJ86_01440, partial [Synergistes sp.]|nr:hypothetical protein [Synergistes sp.]